LAIYILGPGNDYAGAGVTDARSRSNPVSFVSSRLGEDDHQVN